MDNKHIIKEFRSYVDGFVECCTSDHETHELLKAVDKLIEEQEERIAIMEEGGWHFSGTPELPGDALYVYVIVWTGYGRTYPLVYCKRNVRGKYVFRYEWINGDIYRGGEITAWKYFPEPPKDGEA